MGVILSLPMTPQPTDSNISPGRLATIFLAGIGLAVVVCYGQLTQHFFAQDDFVLLQKAACDPAGAVFGFFRDTPGQFRPLTKGLYFVLGHRLFGLNAFPFHVIALVVHIVNVSLVYAVLRKWRVTMAGALIASSLFALSSGFFHVLAWIACIQQLLALMFVLLAIKWGMDAIESEVPAAWASAGAYLLALLSFEETVAIPFVLLFATAVFDGLKSVRMRRAVRALWPHWAVFAAYAFLMLVWKGLPDDGVYGVHFGAHVARNLATYAAWSLHYFTILPGLAEPQEFVFHPTQIVLAALVSYHLIRGRFGPVALALMFFVVTALPAALLEEHRYFLHTYIPSLGILYLVAMALSDVFRMRPLQSSDSLRGALGITLVVLSVGAYYFSHANENAVARWSDPFRSSFVIRRAEIAQNLSASIRRSKSDDVDRVVMVYSRTKFARDDKQSWNNDNVLGAIGGKSAIRLLYDRCDLEVHFARLDEDIPPAALENADVFYYDDMGSCRIQQEVR